MNERTMNTAGFAVPALMRATLFAAEKHRDQRRKDACKTPYINHPIMVANLLANVGRITNLETLQAGLLHDTIEDTDTTADELEEHFGVGVRSLVLEVTDDKSLEKAERKRLQIEHAPHLSPRAKTIKIADKIANLTDILNSPPATWPEKRMQQYVAWSRQVVAGCRGHNRSLEVRYDELARLVGHRSPAGAAEPPVMS
jgi:guanosine-3',5'-bis(diphosphate) 3'-pyrophosphohydrolase